MAENGDSTFIRILLAVIPAVAAPLIAWFMSQRGEAKRKRKLEHLLKRAELVDRLRSQQDDGLGVPWLKRILKNEVIDIVGDLGTVKEPERSLSKKDMKPSPKWRQFLLLNKQASVKGSFYKFFFYAFLIIFITGLAGGIPVMFEKPDVVGLHEKIALLIGLFIYLTVGLVFRSAAVRDYNKRMSKISVQKESGA